MNSRSVSNKTALLFSAAYILLCFVACNDSDNEAPYTVEYYGALKNIMHKGDLSSKVQLSVLDSFEHIYALGAMENLKGEIQVLDGKPFNSIVSGDSLVFDYTLDKNATLLVYAEVKDWHSINIPNYVKTKSDFEKYIITEAEKKDINTSKPFPFLVEGAFDLINWHVINWKDGDKDHSHEKHIKSGLHGELNDMEARFLGFYSDAHHSIFTHHTTNMHIHMKTKNDRIAGHVDDFQLGQDMVLKLPER